MDKKVSITIDNCSIEGIDAIKRVQSLRQIFIKSGKVTGISIPILNNINLSFAYGDKVALIGNNGSGKSSILKLISGIYPPKTGKISINGTITSIIEMGLGVEPEFTGRQNIKILMLYNNMLGKYNSDLENQIIDFSELGDKIDLPVKTYSSGMLARLSFSTSIFQHTDILLLDEVFAAGDGSFINKSLEFMQNKINSTPISIMVSHQEDIIRKYCNRCVLIKNGYVVEDGLPDKILSIYNSGIY